MSRYYRSKELIFEAYQWFKNGDHPEDYDILPNQFMKDHVEGKIVRYFRRPDIEGSFFCKKCGRQFNDHGWINNWTKGIYNDFIVCPGDFIISIDGRKIPLNKSLFDALYQEVIFP